MADTQSLNKDQCTAWLKEIGQSSTGTLEELRTRIQKFSCYPKLLLKLKARAKRHFKFACSLNPLDIPPITARWSPDEIFYPVVNEDTYKQYCSLKKEGHIGQQEKAFRMLQSRKIVSVKTLSNVSDEGIFVKAMIKKPYGTEIRPAVVYFNELMPQKAHCVMLVY